MKFKLPFLLFLLCVAFGSVFGQFETLTIDHGGLTRTYYKHLPANYDASVATPVVVWLHGMGEISVNDVQYQAPAQVFAQIADTANFIVLVPVAENFNMLVTTMRAWNSEAGIGGISPNTDVDDFGFVDAMLDATIAAHNVNEDRLFVCGFSMGGFMTQRFALQHNHRFAAFASVGGTIGANISSTSPNRPIRLAHFHGTDDGTVGYENNTFGMGVEEMLDFWIDHNQCEETPIYESDYMDYEFGTNDEIPVDYYVYGNGAAAIELHKQNGAGHIWPQLTSQEIWRFFSQHEGVLYLAEEKEMGQVSVFPNPTVDHITVEVMDESVYTLTITNVQGTVLLNKKALTGAVTVSAKELGLTQGIYFVNTHHHNGSSTQKVVVH